MQGALASSLLLSVVFVGGIHAWRLLGYKDHNRNDTSTIQRRTVSTLISCIFFIIYVALLCEPTSGPGKTLWQLLGVQLDGLVSSCACCLLLTAVLFLGPIVQSLPNFQKTYKRLFEFMPGQSRWVTVRNYITAPVSEEIVFRACIVRLWLGASFPIPVIVFLSPLCFALAHTHHFLEFIRNHENIAMALQQVALQVFYTNLFGILSSFLLLRTGSLVAVILTHMFCNYQGFPEPDFLSRRHKLYPYRFCLMGTYVLGIIGFCLLLFPLTAGFETSFMK